jgi:hypothetical protein
LRSDQLYGDQLVLAVGFFISAVAVLSLTEVVGIYTFNFVCLYK